MKGIAFLCGFLSALLTSSIILPASCQVVSDGTTNTTVNLNGNNFNILNGIQRGSNLFHSFQEFSIPTGGIATFNNSTDVVNIINRVTGGNISNIDGLIKANGSANLFLINPAGIIFGENARLDIGGSFLGSTAESILFENGFNYSAIDSEQTPLLTVSVPLGLQIGQNPGKIQVNGAGHNLITENANIAPYVNPSSLMPFELRSGLQVREGKNLILVGGDIILDGGILSAEAGKIDLASLKSAEVSLIETGNGLFLSDVKIPNQGNIQLLQRALIDVSGASAGEVNLNGDRLNLKDASVVMAQNRGIQPAGNIKVRAKSVELSGFSADTQIRSSLMSETFALNSGNIHIETEDLKIEAGAAIFSRSFGLGSAGEIEINATESIDVVGDSIFSGISSLTLAQGNSGNIKLSTKDLSVLDNGVITTTTFSNGSAGDIFINSSNIQVAASSQENSEITGVTGITATTFAQGNAGTISIDTQTLSVRDGATVSTSSHNSGNSGDITINATKSIEIGGTNETQAANINSFVLSLGETVTGRLLSLPLRPTGNAGNVFLNTQHLKISDGGLIAVSNIGNAGNAGNIVIEADSLQMRNRSLIGTDTIGQGSGGNITINANTLVALENSDITANAENSFGGKVTVNAKGIFGIQFRESLTPESDITATSELGAEFNGIVELNTPGIDPSSAIVSLPTELTDSSKQIASGCSSNTNSSFIATGRGGIPQNPNQYLTSNLTWLDFRDLSLSGKGNNNSSEVTSMENKPAIVEATGFIRNQNGEIELVAVDNTPLKNKQVADCRGAKPNIMSVKLTVIARE